MFFQTNFKKLVLSKWGAVVAILILLGSGALYLSLYTQAAIPVMDNICGNMWCTAPGGSFFPFPIYPVYGELQALVTIRMDPLDQFIYHSLLKTGLIFNVTLIWWIGAFCYGLLFGLLLAYKGFKTLLRVPPAIEDKELIT